RRPGQPRRRRRGGAAAGPGRPGGRRRLLRRLRRRARAAGRAGARPVARPRRARAAGHDRQRPVRLGRPRGGRAGRARAPGLTPEFHRALLDAGVADLLPNMVIDARPGPDGTGLYSRHPVEAVDVEVEGRSAHPTGLVDVPGAPPVQVTVVHPVPPVGRDLGSWRRTLQTLPRPADDGRVHLLVGDFNATVDQPTMRDLLADGYVDAAAARGRGWVPTWSRGLGPGLAIDHVLVDRATAVAGVSVHGLPGSDHRAVVAELRLPAG